MFTLLNSSDEEHRKEDENSYILFSSFGRCSGTVTQVKEADSLNQNHY
jgi:hypothetical protein